MKLKKKLLGTAIFLVAAFASFGTTAMAEDEKYESYRQIYQAIPALPPIPADNSITDDRLELGQKLYWDRRTSKTGETSCAYCHHPAYYGAEPMERSVGVYGEIHAANAQTVLNASFHPAQFWSGSAPTLEAQALGAIRSHVASRSWPEEVAQRLNEIPGYREMSIKAYGKELDEPIIGKAIATFMRTLNTPDYPLARWLNGDDNAMTEQQKRGMVAFTTNGCASCHASPFFTNFSYQKIMIEGGEHHLGRYKVTKKEEDKYHYKVPSLLNVAMTPPYNHAGTIKTLPEMVKLMGKKMLNKDIPDNEVGDIVAFLGALTGKMPENFSYVPVLPIGGDDGEYGPNLTPSGKE